MTSPFDKKVTFRETMKEGMPLSPPYCKTGFYRFECIKKGVKPYHLALMKR